MYYNIAKRIIEPTLRKNYELVQHMPQTLKRV
nr:MAG TPA: hypothetical protein [Caudoviricetes sp.]